jgi:hypothetical protein
VRFIEIEEIKRIYRADAGVKSSSVESLASYLNGRNTDFGTLSPDFVLRAGRQETRVRFGRREGGNLIRESDSWETLWMDASESVEWKSRCLSLPSGLPIFH